MEYGPLYTNGIGLSDGEMMEWLWSYLHRFSRMTKEMNPSHRIDVLTHSLLYYSQQKIRNLGEINYKALVFIVNVKICCEGSHLCERLKRAERINMIASSELVGSKMSGQSFDRSSN